MDTAEDAFHWETGESYVDWEQIGKEDYTTGIWNPGYLTYKESPNT